jgi:trehalose-6-phosphate synthase
VAAFERLLDTYPMHLGRVVLVQACLASRTAEGHQLRHQLEGRVEAVNRRLATTGWTPIQLIARPLSDQELAALYRDADVALVTPLRDGMNLTGKEFVACRWGVLASPPLLQERPLAARRPHPLPLHRGGRRDAGGNSPLTLPTAQALLVNPYEVGKVAACLHSALTMAPAEAEVPPPPSLHPCTRCA